MPASKKKKHGSGKVYRPKTPVYDPQVITRISLRERLEDSLSLAELAELEKQLRKLEEDARNEAYNIAFKTTWAVVFRGLRDQFGWGKDRLRRLWELGKDYFVDITDGRLNVNEILATLEHDDGISINVKD